VPASSSRLAKSLGVTSDQPVGRVQGGACLQLRRDLRGEGARQAPGLLGPVLGVDGRAGGKGVVPAVPSDLGEEAVEGAEVVDVGLPSGVSGVQASQVAFQELAVEVGERWVTVMARRSMPRATSTAVPASPRVTATLTRCGGR
jgi:hypothetical protein